MLNRHQGEGEVPWLCQESVPLIAFMVDLIKESLSFADNDMPLDGMLCFSFSVDGSAV